MGIETIGVIGAGQMGNGIAHVMALSGYNVVLNDISQPALDKAVDTISRNLARQVGRGKVSEDDMNGAMARIRTSLSLPELGQTDLVIEAATERETVKQAIFEDLVPHLKPETILTSNTSSIRCQSTRPSVSRSHSCRAALEAWLPAVRPPSG